MSELIRVNPERIEWCCNKYGVTLEHLSKKAEIKEQKLTDILGRKEEPLVTYNQLEKLADFFGESLLFFIKSEPVEENNVLTPQFRTFDSQMPIIDIKVKKIIENVVAQHRVFLGLQDDLDIEVEKFKGVNLSNMTVREQATEVRKWLGIDNSKKMVFKDYRHLVEDKNILVFLSAGYQGAWKIPNDSSVIGFSFYDEKVPVIFVKKDNQYSESLSVFTLFHELAHILLHKKTIIDTNEIITSDKGIEREANQLAANILVTESTLRLIEFSKKPERIEDYTYWLQPITERLSVSPDVVLLRLMDYDLISQNEFDNFRAYRKEKFEKDRKLSSKEQSGRRYRSLEPQHMFGDGYVRVIMDALHNKLVTINKASNYLDGIKVKNIKEIERSIYG